jgi:quercetin dioxygenase-like cupin family protein
MKRTRPMALAVSMLVGTVAVGTAAGTPGSGIVASLLARGTLEAGDGKSRHHHDHGRHRHKPVRIELSTPSDLAVQQVTVDPGGTTGWHSHPGPAVVIVKSGSLTLYDGDDRRCRGTRYSAGKVFIDEGYGHVHIGRNEGTTPAELYVTFLDLPVGAAPRIDVPSPGNCPF